MAATLTTAEEARAGRRGELAIFAFYVAAAVVLTWPVAQTLGAVHPDADTRKPAHQDPARDQRANRRRIEPKLESRHVIEPRPR